MHKTPSKNIFLNISKGGHAIKKASPREETGLKKIYYCRTQYIHKSEQRMQYK
ncbi:hypothetical protein OENI_10239 [Oenococcus oeni]|nr:hypothetical protein OENI_10239 [Oenococcus oeni]